MRRCRIRLPTVRPPAALAFSRIDFTTGSDGAATLKSQLVDGDLEIEIHNDKCQPAPLAKMFGIKEVVTTFALAPDGSVGTAPTSTTKSRLHYEKPEVAKNRQDGIKYF